MNKAAIGAAISNRQLAISLRQESRRSSHGLNCNWLSPIATSPIAYRLLPIAVCEVANCCTVTDQRTSVTTLLLAESVLISVGKLAFESQNQVLVAFKRVARALRCSFRGGTCIQ